MLFRSVSKMYFRMVDEAFKPLVFSEAFYLATKGGGKFFGKAGSFEEGFEFDAVIMDDCVLPHPQELDLAERMERAVYLGLDEKNIRNSSRSLLCSLPRLSLAQELWVSAFSNRAWFWNEYPSFSSKVFM